MRTIEEVITELRKDIHSDVYLGKKTINTYLDEILEIHKAESTQGDLISRSALKKEFDDKCAYECAICKYAKDFAPCKLIDNAPTVEQEYYITGAQWDQFMKELKRPHGEWIELETNPPNFLGHRFYICSKCNREIDVMTPDESLDDYPYCHCGACMIKEKP